MLPNYYLIFLSICSVFLRLFGNYRYTSDGLNSLKYYTVHDIETTPLYTRIPVTINADEVAKH